MRPQYPGTWLLHCHVIDHISGGMQAIYTVTEKGMETNWERETVKEDNEDAV